MEPVEAQITFGSRILVAVRPVEGQVHLGVGYAFGGRGGGDVMVDLVDVALENLEVVQPAVVLPGIGGFVGADVGVVDVHGTHDGVAARTQRENLRRYGVPVGLEFRRGRPETVLVIGPTAGPVLVGVAGRPEIVPSDIPGDDLSPAGGALELGVVAEGGEQLGAGPSVLAEVGACDRYLGVCLDVGLVA